MKQSKKRYFNILITSFIFGLFFTFSAFAESGLIYFTDPQSKAGQAVDVVMTIQADGQKIGDVDVLLKYSPDVLEFKKGTNTSGGAGTIRVHGKGEKDGDNKVIFTLTFRTPVAGEYTINVDDYEVRTETNSMIEIGHVGSSVITVDASEGSIGSSKLSVLEVTPGNLDPQFSPDVTDYSVTVGLSVDFLTINALSDDTTANVNVVNNEALKEGENDIIIYVKSQDGVSQSEYHLHVMKTEGGEENITAESVEETSVDTENGVQLSCKGKTITIIDSDNVEVPKGLRESKINIDHQPVKGWVQEDSTDPEYFIVYGMNSDGALNFYRYDIKEKTIQRYFEYADSNDPTNSDEYLALSEELKETGAKASRTSLLLIIIGIVAFLLLVIVIYLAIRLGNVCNELDQMKELADNGVSRRRLDPEKSRRSRNPRSIDRYEDEDEDEDEDNDEDGDGEENEDEDQKLNDYTIIRSKQSRDLEETRVLPQGVRRRSSRKALESGETTVIRRTSRRNSLDNIDF